MYVSLLTLDCTIPRLHVYTVFLLTIYLTVYIICCIVEVTVTESELRELFSPYGDLDAVDGVILFCRNIPG